MLIRTVVSPLLGTNAYVVALGTRAVVVDPGAAVADEVATVLEQDGLDPVAVLLTHGHLDHTWDAGDLSARLDVPVHVHALDRAQLDEPFGALGPLGAQLEAMAGASGLGWSPPSHVVTVEPPAHQVVPFEPVPGVRLELLACPGHTPGSTVLLVPGSGDGATALTGDVLFAGTVGRTDLPGGDPAAMRRSLATLAALDPATVMLPGHGERSTLAAELATNPFLPRVR